MVGADGSFELIEDDGTGDGLDPVDVARTPIPFEQADRHGHGRAGPGRPGRHALRSLVDADLPGRRRPPRDHRDRGRRTRAAETAQATRTATGPA